MTEICQRIVESAMNTSGVREAEVFRRRVTTARIVYREGASRVRSVGRDEGLAIRLAADNGRHAFASRSDLIEGQMLPWILETAQRAGSAPPCPGFRLPRANGLPVPDSPLPVFSPEKEIERAGGWVRYFAEWLGKSESPLAISSMRLEILRAEIETEILNSHGVHGSYRQIRGHLRIRCSLRKNGGGFTYHDARPFENDDTEAFVEPMLMLLAALSRLKSDYDLKGAAEVLFAPRPLATMIGSLLPAILSLCPHERSEDYGGPITVADESVTIVDDPGAAGGYSSCPFDGEGRPVDVLSFIKSGRAHSLKPANESVAMLPMQRGSYSEPPAPGFTNLVLKPATEGSLENDDSLPLVLDAMPARPSGGFRWSLSGVYVKPDSDATRYWQKVVDFGDAWGFLRRVREVGAEPSYYLRPACVGAPSAAVVLPPD